MPRRLPAFVEPALAMLVDDVPTGPGWVFEIKFDGYRCLSAAAGKLVRCYSRGGLDWTPRFGQIPAAIARLGLDGALLDGEIVVVDQEARSDFVALQKCLSTGGRGLSYFVFDLLAERGRDLRGLPLAERKARLKDLIGRAEGHGPVFYSDHVEHDAVSMFDMLCGQRFEGVIAKRVDRPYRSGRSNSWLKIKCGLEQEFVIIGYTVSEAGRPFSSLLLAAHEHGELRQVGRVGTGFDGHDLAALLERFVLLRRATPPVEHVLPGAARREIRWLQPELVAQVGFAGWTGDGVLRHARYLGLREDKPADAVMLERPAPLLRALDR